jgi:hypothetical protein
MANYNREDLEKNSAASVMALASFIATGVYTAANWMKNQKIIKEKTEIMSEIQNLDEDIAQLSSGFLSKWFNSDEIKEKQSKRDKLKNKSNSYGKGKK